MRRPSFSLTKTRFKFFLNKFADTRIESLRPVFLIEGDSLDEDFTIIKAMDNIVTPLFIHDSHTSLHLSVMSFPDMVGIGRRGFPSE